MYLLSTRIYGIINYLAGIFIFSNPWLYDFEKHPGLSWALRAAGAIIVIMSAFTNYEMGIIKIIPVRSRLIPDICIAVFFLLTPWIFNFYVSVFLPQLFTGLLIILAAIFVDPIPSYIKSSYPHL
ncbi:MAG: hypothetical protein ACHQNT_13340 [Bacteroidia bacterium]